MASWPTPEVTATVHLVHADTGSVSGWDDYGSETSLCAPDAPCIVARSFIDTRCDEMIRRVGVSGIDVVFSYNVLANGHSLSTQSVTRHGGPVFE